MIRSGTVFPLILFLALPLQRQDNYPKFEVFGGYSFSRYSVNSNGNNLNARAANFFASDTRYLGWTVDVSGVYGSEPYHPFVLVLPPVPPSQKLRQNLNVYHFLGGPRFTFPTHSATPFGEFLLGAVSLRQEFDGNHNEFAMGFGGGVDVPIGKHLAYRIFQADYIPAKQPQSGGVDGTTTSGSRQVLCSRLVGRGGPSWPSRFARREYHEGAPLRARLSAYCFQPTVSRPSTARAAFRG